MIKIKFSYVSEIRMGSPYNSARVNIEGSFRPNLNSYTLQDKCTIESSGQVAYLIMWDSQNNEPGFRVLKIDEANQTIEKSARIEGCCEDIQLTERPRTVHLKVWHSKKGRFETEVIFPL